MRILAAYIPIIHEGYLRFFQKIEKPCALFIFGPDIISQYKTLGKDIRQVDPLLMKRMIEGLELFDSIELLSPDKARALNHAAHEIILPDEEVSRDVARNYFPDATVYFESIFLRWDKHNSLQEKPIVPDEKISRDEFHRSVLKTAAIESEKSSDIWRHVGAAIAKDGKVLFVAHNEHVPSAHIHYVNGDPRNSFSKGEHIEISTAFHAEATLIARAAATGTSLEGVDMYVTVFPCPPCAKLIAYSGIRNLYCTGGYAVLDGQTILEDKGVKIFFVE
jgi:dCMP deaminase